MAVKFMKHYVQDGPLKVKVYYWQFKDYLVIAAKEYGYSLQKIFADATNDTDVMTDYFDKSRVNIRPGHWAYEHVLKMVKL